MGDQCAAPEALPQHLSQEAPDVDSPFWMGPVDDGCVDGEDLGILLLQWGEGCIAVDLNFDGIVDEDDEDLLTGNYGGDCD